MVALLDRLFPAATDARVTARFAAYRHHLGDYMRRYIVQTPWGTVRLHNILRGDADPHLHDHPWDFWSLLLTGGYTEVRPWLPGLSRAYRRRRFSLVRREATDLHRLILDRPVWTLVWTGPRLRQWGFQTERGWVYWRKYLGVPEQDHVTRDGRFRP